MFLPVPLRTSLASVCAAALLATMAMADLAKPQGPVLLTVSGEITHTNADGTAQFDLTMLRALPAREFTTTTIWTSGPQTFTGVSLDVILRTVGATGETLRSTAINDYAVEIPATDAHPTGPIIAYALNGAPMSVREKGPLWIVYPYDSGSQYRTEVVYSRSIWQLDRIAITD